MAKLTEIANLPRRLFVVGDLHGCPDELGVMLKHFTEQEQISSEDLVVFVGDYIDRGPNSKAVVDQLIDFKRTYPSTVFLRGNHEDMLLDFLGFGGNMGNAFLQNGGKNTLGSYGLPLSLGPDEIAHQLPRDHFSFYLNLDSYVAIGNWVLVHAGLSPIRDLESQLDYDLFWIREEFISNIHPFRKTIVFGHTPYQDVLFNVPYKIGIDTGLVFGNMLTCVELMHGSVLQVKRNGQRVQRRSFPERVLPYLTQHQKTVL